MKYFILSVIFVLTNMSVAVATASNDDYIYCTYNEIGFSDEPRSFYTGIFLGDYSFTAGYTNDFFDYIKAEHDFNGINSYCFFENNHDSAVHRLQGNIREDNDKNIFSKVFQTNWAPDNFTNQDLQDFQMEISGDSSELQVCVRDHECEDGDKIRVSVDSLSVFNGEIDNGWACETINVQADEDYEVELYAINGTGFKGAHCSHQDVNTGEIRITGDNTKTQSWQHRGGGGSSARIIVHSK